MIPTADVYARSPDHGGAFDAAVQQFGGARDRQRLGRALPMVRP